LQFDKRFDKLLTSLRTAVANEYKLDKEQTSYHDILDAFRLSLQLYQRSKQMRRRGAAKSRISYAKPNDDKVIISSEYCENDRPSYICSFCNQTLIRLTEAGQNNSTFWCRHCSVEFDPESENLRKESR
jgi:DNA-directed RNA polymerase subunit RPC12/RpoP